MPRKTRTSRQHVIRVSNLINYRNYAFAWFSEIALKLCTGRSFEDINESNINTILSDVSKCCGELIDRIQKSGADPCTVRALPMTGNDPKNKMNLCYANKVLSDASSGLEVESTSLPSALSLEFAEFTRSFMGAGSLKRDVFVIGEDVLALSVIGAYLSKSYVANRGNEYGYVYVDVVPYLLTLDRFRALNSVAKKLVGAVQLNEGSMNAVLVAIATAVGIVAGKTMRDILKSNGHAIANYLRMARTGNKIMAKGIDSIDLVQLARLIMRGGVAGALYTMISRYPPKEFSSLRRFIELVSANLIRYQNTRRPQYIYEILRYLTAQELNDEGAKWYVKRKEKELEWREIVERFSRLYLLVA